MQLAFVATRAHWGYMSKLSTCRFFLAKLLSSMGLTHPRYRTRHLPWLKFMCFLSALFSRLLWSLWVAALPSSGSQLLPPIRYSLQTWKAFFPIVQTVNNDVKKHWSQNWPLDDATSNWLPAGLCTAIHSPLIQWCSQFFTHFYWYGYENTLWKAFQKSNNTHCCPLTCWASHLLMGGSKVGQAWFACSKSMPGVPNHLLVLYVPGHDIEKDLLHTIPRDIVWVEKTVVPWNHLLTFLDDWCNVCLFLVIGELPSPQSPQHFKGGGEWIRSDIGQLPHHPWMQSVWFHELLYVEFS